MKKILLSLGMLTGIITPILTVVSCDAKDKVADGATTENKLKDAEIFDRTITMDFKVTKDEDDFKIGMNNPRKLNEKIVSEQLTKATSLIRRCVHAIYDPIGWVEIASAQPDQVAHTTQSKKVVLNLTTPNNPTFSAEIINTGNRQNDVRSFAVQFQKVLNSLNHVLPGFSDAFSAALKEDGLNSIIGAFHKFEEIQQ